MVDHNDFTLKINYLQVLISNINTLNAPTIKNNLPKQNNTTGNNSKNEKHKYNNLSYLSKLFKDRLNELLYENNYLSFNNNLSNLNLDINSFESKNSVSFNSNSNNNSSDNIANNRINKDHLLSNFNSNSYQSILNSVNLKGNLFVCKNCNCLYESDNDFSINSLKFIGKKMSIKIICNSCNSVNYKEIFTKLK